MVERGRRCERKCLRSSAVKEADTSGAKGGFFKDGKH